MIWGGAYCILWSCCIVAAARAFVVPPTTTSFGTSPSSSLARDGNRLRPPNQKEPTKEKRLWYQEKDMWDGKNRMREVEKDMKKVNEQLGYVRQDVIVVRTVVKGLAKDVGRVRKQAEKNKRELTKQAEKNKKELTTLINATKTELFKEMAGIKSILEFAKMSFITIVLVGICTLVGIKVDWGSVSGFVKTCISAP